MQSLEGTCLYTHESLLLLQFFTLLAVVYGLYSLAYGLYPAYYDRYMSIIAATSQTAISILDIDYYVQHTPEVVLAGVDA